MRGGIGLGVFLTKEKGLYLFIVKYRILVLAHQNRSGTWLFQDLHLSPDAPHVTDEFPFLFLFLYFIPLHAVKLPLDASSVVSPAGRMEVNDQFSVALGSLLLLLLLPLLLLFFSVLRFLPLPNEIVWTQAYRRYDIISFIGKSRFLVPISSQKVVAARSSISFWSSFTLQRSAKKTSSVTQFRTGGARMRNARSQMETD